MSKEKLSVEELLESLHKDTPESQDRLDNDISEFIEVFRLQPGKNQVRCSVIHKLYRSWSKSPVKQTVLTPSLLAYIGKHGDYYLISEHKTTVTNTLLKHLEVPKSPRFTQTFFQKQFERFLAESHIERGTSWIEKFVLYHIYKKWLVGKKTAKLGPVVFANFCDLYLKFKDTKQGRFYAIQDLLTGITQEELDQVRKEHHEEKRKPKKSHKVSRSATKPQSKD